MFLISVNFFFQFLALTKPTMNQNIKPLTTLLLLSVFVALLAGKFWAYGEAKGVRSFSYMHRHPDGTAYIALGNRLFGFDRRGQATGQIDLTRLGADADIVSDFAFFSNGDLLFRRHIGEHDFVYDLQRYFRMPNLHDKAIHDQQFGLFHCNLQNYSCRAFTRIPLNLNDAFALSIDWKTDRVFISDASRHSVYLFSGQGDELDVKTGFFYPNQILFQDNRLFVADTNHHSLAVLPVDGNKLGPIASSMDTRQGPALASGEIWPSSFLLLPDRRWILNANNGMANGGVYVFDSENEFKKRLDLPDSADPVELLKLGEHVLISDFSRDRIYRFNLAGEYLGDFNPKVMQPHLNGIKDRRLDYKNLDRLFTGLFIFSLAAGLGISLYQQGKTPVTETLPDSSTPHTVDLSSPEIYWIKPAFKFKLVLAFICVISVLLCTVSIVLSLSAHAYILSVAKDVLLFSLIIAFFLSQVRRKIGITDDFLVMVQPLRRPKIYARDTLVYSNKLVSNGSDFFRIDAFNNIFSGEELLQHIYPFIKQGRYIDDREMQGMIMRNKYIFGVLMVTAIGAVLFFIYLSTKDY